MLRTVLAGLALAAVATTASAEVRSRADNGFTLVFERPITASPETVLEAVAMPAGWWSSAHTYSGDAANIRLDLIPGGCWCEALPGGGVKHAEVVLVWPQRNMVRFEAPFGPLQGMGADAILTMTWAEPAEGGDRVLRWTFVAEGPGTGAMADVIDGVMGEQFGRLAQRLNGDG